jgi:[ribosomal protein S5]-alanine N-acetyltransferase
MNSQFVLKGKTILLVPFTKSHLNETYLSWLHDYEVIKLINRKEYLLPVSIEKIKEYVSKIGMSETDYLFAIESENKFIGTFKFSNIDWNHRTVNLGVLIGEKDYWGKGVSTEAFQLALKLCFTKLGMRKVVAGCLSPNIGMKKVLEKVGFSQEACLRQHDFMEGKYVDHYKFGILKGEYLAKKQEGKPNE